MVNDTHTRRRSRSVSCAVVNDAGDKLIVHAERLTNAAVDAIHLVCLVK